MKSITLRIADLVWQSLRDHHLATGKQVETLSYIFAEVYETEDAVRVLVPHTAPLIRFGADCFARQSEHRVQLYDDVQRGLLIAFARTHHACLINIHDHWFDDDPSFSAIDDTDDVAFDRYMRERFEPALPQIEGAFVRRVFNLSLVLGRKGAAARIIDGRQPRPFRALKQVTIVGDRMRTIHRPVTTPKPLEARHSRQRDFIAPEHQAALASLHALIVGCGGTGSILAEALGRAGIGAMTVIDGDDLEETNLNRWQGGEPWMAQKPKALLLARRLRAMFPEMQVRYHARSLFHPSAEPLLRDADVLFGAVDADAPRLFLNRVALQHLMPYFDAGVAVTRDDDGAVDFRTRMFAVYPGTSACLECTSFMLFDREQARLAFLDEGTAAELRQAGYVTGQPELITPSVYALNQRAVGLAVTEFLNWVCGWRPAGTVISESWRSGTMQRADRGNFPEAPDPNCPLCSYLAGAGSLQPLPRPASFAPRRRIPSSINQGA